MNSEKSVQKFTVKIHSKKRGIMKTSYREIIIKNIPHSEDDENFYNNAIKKINEMLGCLDLKGFMDSAIGADLSESAAKKIKIIITRLYENYSSEDFGKVIRSSELDSLLKADCLSDDCKKIDVILGFYKSLAALIEKDKRKYFIFSFCIARKCLCLKQVRSFFNLLSDIPQKFGPLTEDAICLTKYCFEKSADLMEELNGVIDNFSEIRFEECSENAIAEISSYSKEEDDAQFLSSNYLIQIYDDERFKKTEEKIENLRKGTFNSRNRFKIQELIAAQKKLIAELGHEYFNLFLENQNDKDYWRGIYEKWIKTGKINSSAVNGRKSSDEVLAEAIQG